MIRVTDETKYCPTCRMTFIEELKHCPYCGAKLKRLPKVVQK